MADATTLQRPAAAPLVDAGRRKGGFRHRLQHRVLPVFTALAILYLMVPIVVMIVFSFNKPDGKFNYIWSEFSLDGWLHPFDWPGLGDAVGTSLTVALLSTVIATIIGTMMGLALTRYYFRGRGALNGIIFLPMATPEIVMGASLLTLFVATALPPLAGSVPTLYPTGFLTILIAHIMFNISYVVVTVKARLAGLRSAPRGGGDGPRGERVHDVLEGDLPADPARDHGRRTARVQPVDRRLRDHELRVRARRTPSRSGSTRSRAMPCPSRSTSSARSSSSARSALVGLDDAAFGAGRPHPLTQETPPPWSTPCPRLRSGSERSPARPSVVPPVWSRITNLAVDRGEGSWLITADGERYLDYSSGIGVTNTGHAHPRVVAAVQAQAAKLLHGQQNILYHEAGLRLYERLRHVLPGDGWGAFLSNSGAEAVEASVKLARVATGRPVDPRLPLRLSRADRARRWR